MYQRLKHDNKERRGSDLSHWRRNSGWRMAFKIEKWVTADLVNTIPPGRAMAFTKLGFHKCFRKWEVPKTPVQEDLEKE